jgi:hypothetical protein
MATQNNITSMVTWWIVSSDKTGMKDIVALPKLFKTIVSAVETNPADCEAINS